MQQFKVVIKTECTMLVEVSAKDRAEAKRKARDADYDPLTEWTPIDYGKLRVVNFSERPS